MSITNQTCFLQVALLIAFFLALSCGFSDANPSLPSTCAAADQSCRTSQEEVPPQAPLYLKNGEMHTLDGAWEPIIVLDDTAAEEDNDVTTTKKLPIPGGESVGLQYLQNVLTQEEVSQLIQICNDRNGWTESPQNLAGEATVQTGRTSSSCPMVWPLSHLPRLPQLAEAGLLTAAVKKEIDLTWNLTQRLAKVLRVENEARMEPFQLIRYTPGQFYQRHHDHGSFYGSSTEQRPMTLLVFLSSVPPEDGGGHTRFTELDVAVLPRSGDGIVWKNQDAHGNVLVEAMHEAVRPMDETTVKYAMNVWVDQEPITSIDTAAYRTTLRVEEE